MSRKTTKRSAERATVESTPDRRPDDAHISPFKPLTQEERVKLRVRLAMWSEKAHWDEDTLARRFGISAERWHSAIRNPKHDPTDAEIINALIHLALENKNLQFR